MTDTVLQSFCERCGTRYTFTEQDTRRESGLTKIGRSLGLRGAPKPVGEPTVADALPTHDPFRATFHFCLQCRQYTCQNCWNPEAGFCQTCYPLGQVDLRAAEDAASAEAKQAGLAALTASAGLATAGPALRATPAPDNVPSPGAIPASGTIPSPGFPATDDAWPMSDLERAARASAAAPVPTEIPASDVQDGPSPWGPGVADVAADETWDADRGFDGDPVDPQGGQDSVAAAILRGAGGPASGEAAEAVDDWPREAATPFVEVAAVDAALEQATVGTVDPWRGLVYSSDEPEAPGSELVDTPPALDPELPWIAQPAVPTDGSVAGPAGPAGEVPDETPLLADDEDERDIDHRGWIAASTIATGSGWSAPVPASQDEAVAAAAAAAAEVETRAERDADTGSPWVAATTDPTAVDEGAVVADPEQPVAWIEPTDDLGAPAVAGSAPASDEPAAEPAEADQSLATAEESADVLVAADGADLVEGDPWGAPEEDDFDAWPAADTLPPAVAIPAAAPAGEPDGDHEWVGPVLAAAAAGAVIDERRDDDWPGFGLPAPEAPAFEPDVQPIAPAAFESEEVPAMGWTPTLQPPVATPYVPVATGPFASQSPLLPEPAGPYVPPVEAIPAYMPLPPLPLAPPPPLGMGPPPPAPPPAATTYAASMPPVPGVGLQAPPGPAPAALAAGPAGQAKARPCQSCALPLSAKARFCRRCGAQQAA